MATHITICKNCGKEYTTQLPFTNVDTRSYVVKCINCSTTKKVKKKWWKIFSM